MKANFTIEGIEEAVGNQPDPTSMEDFSSFLPPADDTMNEGDAIPHWGEYNWDSLGRRYPVDDRGRQIRKSKNWIPKK